MPKRLFVAIDLLDSTRHLLAGLDLHIRGVRWTEPTQMHLTLGFFDDVPDDVDSALREKLSANRYSLFLTSLFFFVARSARVVSHAGVNRRSCEPGRDLLPSSLAASGRSRFANFIR
jgi:2'-5' RNA ligase